MKKIIAITAALLCIFSLLTLSSCGGKTEQSTSVAKVKSPITLEKFETVVKSNGFTVEELNSDLNLYIDNKWYRATMGDVQVWFYMYGTAEHAKDLATERYENTKSQEGVSSEIGDNYIYTSVIGTGIITTSYQVDNTETIFKYSNESVSVVNQLIAEFGY